MTKQNITRRELLKAALAAGTGLTAAAFLPEKWLKPVVLSGVTPAHANTSGASVVRSTISGYVYYGSGNDGYVAGAVVRVTNPHLSSKPTPKTGGEDDGYYSIDNVPIGEREITCDITSVTSGGGGPVHDSPLTFTVVVDPSSNRNNFWLEKEPI